MRTIYKYELKEAITSIPVGAGAVPLCVQIQFQAPQIWVEIDTLEPTLAELNVALVGTGHPVPADAEYLNTVQMHDGHLVWHVYTKLVTS